MTERLVIDEVLAGTLIHHLDDAAGAEANSNAILEASSLQTYRSLLLARSDAVSRQAVGTLIALSESL